LKKEEKEKIYQDVPPRAANEAAMGACTRVAVGDAAAADDDH